MHAFGHIGIRVSDMEESKAFYSEVLQCKVLKEDDHPGMRLVLLDGGGTVIELIFKEGDQKRSDGPMDHIAFKVPHLDTEIKALKERGIPLIDGPRTVGKSRIAFFRGPNGEKIEFMEQLS